MLLNAFKTIQSLQPISRLVIVCHGPAFQLALELAINPETIRHLGQAAYLTAQNLDWESVFKSLLEDYRQLLAG